MKCPYCDHADTRMNIHAHLASGHSDQVELRSTEESVDLAFVLDCPFCEEGLEKAVNPRGKDPEFLERFEQEIRLVAFDLLLYHCQADHPEKVGLASEVVD